jgi:hypothetical protein
MSAKQPDQNMMDYYCDTFEVMAALAMHTRSDGEYVGALMNALCSMLAVLPADGAEKMLSGLPALLMICRDQLQRELAADKADEAIQAAMRG